MSAFRSKADIAIKSAIAEAAEEVATLHWTSEPTEEIEDFKCFRDDVWAEWREWHLRELRGWLEREGAPLH